MKFIRINEENGGDLIEKYDIGGFPTFALFKNGKMVDSKSGKMEMLVGFQILKEVMLFLCIGIKKEDILLLVMEDF